MLSNASHGYLYPGSTTVPRGYDSLRRAMGNLWDTSSRGSWSADVKNFMNNFIPTPLDLGQGSLIAYALTEGQVAVSPYALLSHDVRSLSSTYCVYLDAGSLSPASFILPRVKSYVSAGARNLSILVSGQSDLLILVPSLMKEVRDNNWRGDLHHITVTLWVDLHHPDVFALATQKDIQALCFGDRESLCLGFLVPGFLKEYLRGPECAGPTGARHCFKPSPSASSSTPSPLSSTSNAGPPLKPTRKSSGFQQQQHQPQQQQQTHSYPLVIQEPKSRDTSALLSHDGAQLKREAEDISDPSHSGLWSTIGYGSDRVSALSLYRTYGKLYERSYQTLLNNDTTSNTTNVVAFLRYLVNQSLTSALQVRVLDRDAMFEQCKARPPMQFHYPTNSGDSHGNSPFPNGYRFDGSSGASSGGGGGGGNRSSANPHLYNINSHNGDNLSTHTVVPSHCGEAPMMLSGLQEVVVFATFVVYPNVCNKEEDFYNSLGVAKQIGDWALLAIQTGVKTVESFESSNSCTWQTIVGVVGVSSALSRMEFPRSPIVDRETIARLTTPLLSFVYPLAGTLVSHLWDVSEGVWTFQTPIRYIGEHEDASKPLAVDNGDPKSTSQQYASNEGPLIPLIEQSFRDWSSGRHLDSNISVADQSRRFMLEYLTKSNQENICTHLGSLLRTICGCFASPANIRIGISAQDLQRRRQQTGASSFQQEAVFDMIVTNLFQGCVVVLPEIYPFTHRGQPFTKPSLASGSYSNQAYGLDQDTHGPLRTLPTSSQLHRAPDRRRLPVSLTRDQATVGSNFFSRFFKGSSKRREMQIVAGEPKAINVKVDNTSETPKFRDTNVRDPLAGGITGGLIDMMLNQTSKTIEGVVEKLEQNYMSRNKGLPGGLAWPRL